MPEFNAEVFLQVVGGFLVLSVLAAVAWKDRLSLLVLIAVLVVEENFRSGFSTEEGALGLPSWMTYGHTLWVRPPRLPSLIVVLGAVVVVADVLFERGLAIRQRGRTILAIATTTLLWIAAVVFEPSLSGEWVRPASGSILLLAGIVIGIGVMRRPPSDEQVARFALAFLVFKLVMGAAVTAFRPAHVPDLVAFYDAVTPAFAGCVALTALVGPFGIRRNPRLAVLLAVAVILVAGRRTPIVATALLALLLPVITGRARAALRIAASTSVAAVVFILVAPGSADRTISGLSEGVNTIVGTGADESTRGHLGDLALGWELALDHPLLGLGPDAAQVSEASNVQTDALYLHNDYLQTWLRFGLPALLGLISIAVLAARSAVANLRSPNSSVRTLASLFCLFVPIYMVMFPATSTVQRWAVLYGIAIGIVCAVPKTRAAVAEGDARRGEAVCR